MASNKAPSIFRVKRRGKLTGSFLCQWQGRRVNLRTDNAHEARSRARGLVAGTWSPASGSADAGAAAAVQGLKAVDSPPPTVDIRAAADEVASASAAAPPSDEAPSAPEAPPVLDGAAWAGVASEASSSTVEAPAAPADPLADPAVAAEVARLKEQAGLLPYVAGGLCARWCFKLFRVRREPGEIPEVFVTMTKPIVVVSMDRAIGALLSSWAQRAAENPWSVISATVAVSAAFSMLTSTKLDDAKAA